MEKRLIISPHSDDALFSCGHALFQPQYGAVEILTIENDPKRRAEDECLYGFLGIPVHHLPLTFHDESYYGFFKKERELTDGNVRPYLEEYFGRETLSGIEEETIRWVARFLKKHSDYVLMAPLGIGHPFHLFIRMTVDKTTAKDVEYYREFPHSYKKRSRGQMERTLTGGWELKRSVDVSEFHDIKWQLARRFYRTQSGLLFYEQGYIRKRLAEEIYVRNVDDLPF